MRLGDLIEDQKEVNDLQILPVTLEHALALEHLADHHKDSFDRLIVAQSQLEDLDILGNDSVIKKIQ